VSKECSISIKLSTRLATSLERRHPHVFGDAKIATAREQNVAWEKHKQKERTERGVAAGALDDVPIGLPALTRAAKLGKRASSVGFDWPNLDGVLEKVEEEIANCGMRSNRNRERT